MSKFLIFLTLILAFITKHSVECNDWYPFIYDCDYKNDTDTQSDHVTKEKSGHFLSVVTDEYYHAVATGNVITCVKITDNWPESDDNGLVGIEAGGLYHRSIDVRIRSKISMGFSFTIELQEGPRP